jgi:uncharacterized iron-regulated membrane protein
MELGQTRRRRIVIDRSFQFQYLAIWMLTGAGIVLLAGAGFWMWKHYVAGRNPELGVRILQATVGMGIFVLIFCLIMGLLSVLLTHRVAGAA